MSNWGKGLLVFALLSTGCAKRSEQPAAAQPAAESGYDDQQEQATPTPPPAPAPPPADEAPASTKSKDEDRADSLGQAIEEFDRARLELSQLLGRDIGPAPEASAPAAPAAGAAQASAPKEAPRSRASADKAASSREAEGKPLKKGDDGCVNVCRAFDSLTRSAAAVCRLDEGERCRKANQVVAFARDDAGVKACACKK